MGSSIRPFILINFTRLCSASNIMGGMTESWRICFSLFYGQRTKEKAKKAKVATNVHSSWTTQLFKAPPPHIFTVKKWTKRSFHLTVLEVVTVTMNIYSQLKETVSQIMKNLVQVFGKQKFSCAPIAKYRQQPHLLLRKSIDDFRNLMFTSSNSCWKSSPSLANSRIRGEQKQ